jgi:hypothetical protein
MFFVLQLFMAFYPLSKHAAKGKGKKRKTGAA